MAMKNIFKVKLILISISVSSFCLAAKQNCLSQHILDAIKLNKERKEIYKSITQGKSSFVSNLLIKAEQLALPIAYSFDIKARKYQNKGLPLLCLDAIDMDQTPVFSYERSYPYSTYEDVYKLDIKNFIKVISNSISTESYFTTTFKIDQKIKKLEEQMHYNCLTRHFLESIRRSTYLATFYILEARNKGLPSPKGLINLYLKAQLNTLYITNKIDFHASKIQETGVPIICQDVPHIPLPGPEELESFFTTI